MFVRKQSWVGVYLFGVIAVAAAASDHGDTPVLTGSGRHDARITDLFAFVDNDYLVLPICLNPAIPPGVQHYQFPSDLNIKIFVDRDCPVDFTNPADMTAFGGTIPDPAGIQEDIVFDIHFDTNGIMQLAITGLTPLQQSHVQSWYGLRDDPFIRGPQIGKDVSAIVFQLPLADVITSQSTLLIWGMSKVEGLGGDINDHVGRSLRSQLGPNLALNDYHPRDHLAMTGLTPDVIIFDTSLPATFPNGRLLTDDVVDLVGVPAVLASDAPFPSENDVPFLPYFPFLAPPHSTTVPTLNVWGLAALALALLILAKLRFARFAPAAVRH